jgi:hypothetical protein
VITGIVDLHVHSAPSIVPRHTSDPGTAAVALETGMATFVLKAHEGSTAERAELLGGGAVGGVVLNSPVGGANPDAVAVAAHLDARVVWLPTISSPAHKAAHRNPELHAHAGLAFRQVPVVEDGRLRAEWLDVFDEVAARDLLLASGHLALDETVVAFSAARARGVRRLLVNHPLLGFLGWRDEHADALRALDARLEVGVLADLLAGEGRTTEYLLDRYPLELLAFGSDLGHAHYPRLDDGLAAWTARLLPQLGDDGLTRLMISNGKGLLEP